MTHRAWCFTLNNPDEQLTEDTFGGDKCRYAIWQEESAPGTGTRHYQGYVEFTTPVRLSGVRKLLERAHWEPRRGTREQARDYCRKPDRLDGPWELGSFDAGGAGRRTDLADAIVTLGRRGRVADIAHEQPAVFVKFFRGFDRLASEMYVKARRLELKVYVLWGRAGTGKSRYVWDMWGDDLYSLFSQSPLWFDGYRGEKTLLIEEFEVGGISREMMLKILDIYPLQVPVKGGSVYAQWTKVYITANFDFTSVWDTALKRRVTSVKELI